MASKAKAGANLKAPAPLHPAPRAEAASVPRAGKVRPDPAPAPDRKTPFAKPAATHPNAGRTFFELARMNPRQLEEIFAHGVTPRHEELLGWEFRGFNPPIFARILGFQKFKKGFFADAGQTADGPFVSGYNVWVRQNRLEDPHLATPSEDQPKRHGFFLVDRVDPAGRENKHPHALLLDYGKGRNAKFNPERVIRDYLVRVDPGNPDLFLGKAYMALGPLRVFSNFFVLDRYNESNFDPSTLR
jgi:hypothetical protein